MATEKEFRVRKGLVVANTVLVTNGQNIGIGTNSPTEKLTINGTASVANTLTISGIASINSTGLYHTGIVNAGSFTSGLAFVGNTTGVYHSGTVNTATLYVGNSSSSFNVNSVGAYHTGTINAASHTVGTSLIGNSTGLYHTGLVNSATLTVGTSGTIGSMTANTTGVYHPGVVNAASHTVGSSLIGNSTGLYHTGLVNASTINASSHTVGSSLIGNSTGLYHTGLVNSATLTVGNTSNYLTVNATGAYHNGYIVANGGFFSDASNPTINLSSSTLTLINALNSSVNTVISPSSINTSNATFSGVVTVSGNLIVSGNIVTTGVSQANGDFNPYTTNTFSLGNTSNRWSNVLSYKADISSSLNVGNSTFNTAITSSFVNVSLSNTSANNIVSLQITNTTAIVKLSNSSVNTQIAVPTSTQYSSANIFLRANGSWGDVATVVGGSDTYVQYNDGGSVGGSAGLTFVKTTNNLSVANSLFVGTTVNATSFTTTNVSINTTAVSINAVTIANSSGFTTSGFVNAASVSLGTIGAANGFAANTSSLTVGNSSVNTTINATSFTGTSNNSLYLGGTLAANFVGNTGLVTNSTGTHVNTTYIATLTANNANNLGGVAAASYVQNTDSRVLSGNLSLTGASLTLSNTLVINAQGSNGVSGQFLSSNGTAVYWTNPAQSQRLYQKFTASDGQKDFVVSGGSYTNNSIDVYYNGVHLTPSDDFTQNGASGTVSLILAANAGAIVEVSGWTALYASGTDATTLGGILSSFYQANLGLIANSTGTHVRANTGIVANSTGTFVNATYIGTLSANNASFLGGVAASNYQAANGLSSDVNGIRVNANTGIISNTTGIFVNAAYINTISSNNASYLGGIISSAYFQTGASGTTTLSGNVYFTGANVSYSTGLKVLSTLSNVNLGISSVSISSNDGVTTTTTTINSTAFSGTSNNASYLGGQLPSYYLNAGNFTGTLSDARLSSAIVNTSGSFTLSGLNKFTSTSSAATTTVNGVTINATAITIGNTLTSTTISTTSFSGTAANATNLNSQPGSYYTNSVNMTVSANTANSITSPLAWNSDNYNQYSTTAQAADFTISADAGNPTDGKKAIFRFLDNGTPRTITFTGGSAKAFKPVGIVLTVSGSNWTYTTTANKTVYFGCIYNASSARWEIIAQSIEA